MHNEDNFLFDADNHNISKFLFPDSDPKPVGDSLNKQQWDEFKLFGYTQ